MSDSSPAEVEDDAAHLAQWSELAQLVAAQQFPLGPRPDWSQDVAFLAAVIDDSWHLITAAEAYINHLVETYPGWGEDGTFSFPDGMTISRPQQGAPS